MAWFASSSSLYLSILRARLALADFHTALDRRKSRVNVPPIVLVIFRMFSSTGSTSLSKSLMSLSALLVTPELLCPEMRYLFLLELCGGRLSSGFTIIETPISLDL